MPAPKLLIGGGSNGARKSTFAVPYAARIGLPFLNADVLTKRYEETGEKQPLIKAARAFMTTLDDVIERGESICIETTLSGHYITGVVERAKSRGYRVELIFLFLSSPEIAIRRVAARVDKGGHDVPVEDIRRRFDRTFTNFLALKDQVSEYKVYYSEKEPRVLTRLYDGTSFYTFDQDANRLFEQIIRRL